MGPFEVIKIGPNKYNELHMKMKNVNKILGWSHARAIENVIGHRDVSLAVADQFGDESIIKSALFEKAKNIELVQMHKAERDISVAAASILARETFLKAIQDQKLKYSFDFPLGANNHVIETGIMFAKKNGLKMLDEVAKTHFKTLDNIKQKL